MPTARSPEPDVALEGVRWDVESLVSVGAVSSVDDVEALSGRVALALLLAGGPTGHYGIKDSATDGVAPPIDSIPVPSG